MVMEVMKNLVFRSSLSILGSGRGVELLVRDLVGDAVDVGEHEFVGGSGRRGFPH
jgi:hypothetical protein